MTGETKSLATKKHFTVEEANRSLPLVQAIVRDIAQLARSLRDRQDRLARVQSAPRSRMADAYREELDQAQDEFERDQERLAAYVRELSDLGIELKDYFTGLVDFPCLMEDREVYLCWRLGEQEVGHWHELEAGFAGRKKLSRRTSPSA
jgi:hypothetical protein